MESSSHCEIHTMETLNLFCPKHDKLICESCVTASHQNCPSILSLSDAVKSYKIETAIKDIGRRLETLHRSVESTLSMYVQVDSLFNEQKQNIKANIADIKRKIMSHLDKMEEKLEKDLNKEIEEKKLKIKTLSHDLPKKRDNVNQWRKDLEYTKECGCKIKLFQMMKILDVKVHKEERIVQDIRQQTTIPFVKFWPAENIQNLEKTINCFGTYRFEESNILNSSVGNHCTNYKANQREFTSTASFKATSINQNASLFYGAIIPQNRLVFSDKDDKCMHVCKRDGHIIKTIDLDFKPGQIANYDGRHCLIAAGNKGVQIIDHHSFSMVKSFRTTSYCGAITSLHKSIWIKCGNDLIKCDINGKTLKKIQVDFNVREICVDDEDTIYYSNYDNNDIYKVSTDGDHEKFYSSHSLKDPDGIVVLDNNDVIIAGFQSHNIHRVSCDGYNGEIILTGADGIKWPTKLSYSNETKELLIVNNISDSVKIYKFT